MSDHISVDELADASEALLEPGRADAVRTHLADCPACREAAELLAAVSTTLSAQPPTAMPAPVMARLDAVIAQEQAQREITTEVPRGAAGIGPSGIGPGGADAGGVDAGGVDAGGTDAGGTDAGGTGADVLAWKPRPRLAAPPPAGPHRGRAAGWILAAAAAATLVGFGGYVVSARAGLNEPPSGAAAVSSGELSTQAGDLERRRDVDPHRFSRAWSCAREVTDGRITGIVSVTVDGSPALLVYLGGGDGQRVAVVEGCDRGAPRLTASTPLTR